VSVLLRDVTCLEAGDRAMVKMMSLLCEGERTHVLTREPNPGFTEFRDALIESGRGWVAAPAFLDSV
jgi:hypothetical protein